MSVKPLIGFGIGLLIGGWLWMMYEEVITAFFSSYVIDTTDEYYLLSNLLWDAIPYILIFLGIALLVFGSMSGRTTQTGGGE